MKIAFLGLKDSIDYFQIGGTESFVRRLSAELVKKGIMVDYILYGYKKYKELSPLPGLTLKYFKSFEDALDAIDGKYEHVITVYLPPKDRLKYCLFRRKYTSSTVFHFIYFSWPDSLLKRKLYFSEARLFLYNGKLFCISKRQYDYIKAWAKNAVYLLPPVPDAFFLKPEEKKNAEKLRVTFLGRIDTGKGINEVIEIFKFLKNDKRLECSIYGIHIPENREYLNIHNWLKQQKDINYVEVDRQRYSPEIEEMTANILKNTDILILPYQKLSSTIDTPLTLLEAMASLCVVITKPFGNIPDIYGESRFLITPENFIVNTINLLKDISHDDLIEERKRIFEQNNLLDFRATSIGRKFIDAITE